MAAAGSSVIRISRQLSGRWPKPARWVNGKSRAEEGLLGSLDGEPGQLSQPVPGLPQVGNRLDRRFGL